jgi:NAD+ synthase (glutamine-hydrolysing)
MSSSLEDYTQLPVFLKDSLTSIRNKKRFNAKVWIDEKTDKFNKYMRDNNLTGCVVSVSGGVDSSVTYLLAKHAMKKDDSPIKKLLGIAQPIKSTESVWSRALLLEDINDSDGQITILDQSDAFKNLVYEVKNKVFGVEDSARQFADGQLKSYMRTPVNYYAAQLLSAGGFPSIVLGTGNKDEDQYLAYFCKAGDGVVDVQLISDLHKSEVFAIGRELSVPGSILNAPPTADLWEGQTDEDELGFTYDFVELLLEYQDMSEENKNEFQKVCIENNVWDYFTETKLKAEAIHNRNKHKLNFPVNL